MIRDDVFFIKMLLRLSVAMFRNLKRTQKTEIVKVHIFSTIDFFEVESAAGLSLNRIITELAQWLDSTKPVLNSGA